MICKLIVISPWTKGLCETDQEGSGAQLQAGQTGDQSQWGYENHGELWKSLDWHQWVIY